MTTHELKRRRTEAFTLIELLVVIGIIALLAALVIPAAGVAIRSMQLKRATADLHQIETAIDRYKARKGFYPPDNSTNTDKPQLFYELTGSYLMTNVFYRINGAEKISQTDVQTAFNVGGFMNASPLQSMTNRAEIQAAEAKDYWPNLPSEKYAVCEVNGVNVALLGLIYEGPTNLTTVENMPFNAWHYNSSNPTNNPDSYDLWIDIKVASPVPFADPKYKINRICNWSDIPVIVNDAP